MEKVLLQNALDAIENALANKSHQYIETIILTYGLNKLLSQKTISIARRQKKISLVIFLCTLAISNEIETPKATHWLNIYQSIAAKNETAYIKSIKKTSVIRLAVEAVIFNREIKIKNLEIADIDIESLIDSIEILFDNNMNRSGMELIGILKKYTTHGVENKKLYLNILEKYSINENYIKHEMLENNIETSNKPLMEIIISGKKLNYHLDRCLNSVKLQTNKNYRLHILSDDDPNSEIGGPLDIMQRYDLGQQPIVNCSRTRQGKASLIFNHFQNFTFEDHSIAVILDADDMLYRKSALDIIAETYLREDVDACWSTYIRSDNVLGHSAPLINGYHHRQQGWRSSHCFTFKAKLLKKVPVEYILDGNYNPVMQACDIAIALPILDIAKKTSFIPETLYYYEVSNPDSHHNQSDGIGLSSKKQIDTAKYLYSKKPLIIE